MAYVITEPCLGVTDSTCVGVCPVECIKDGTIEIDGKVYEQLFIDPDGCIDCGMCKPECPVDAIFPADELPPQWTNYAKVNAEFWAQNP